MYLSICDTKLIVCVCDFVVLPASNVMVRLLWVRGKHVTAARAL